MRVFRARQADVARAPAPAVCRAAGCLIVKNCIDGKPCFDYPVLGPDGDEEAALCAIEDYCVEQGISLELSVVPKEKAAKLLERYPRFHLNNFSFLARLYLRANDLREFPGRHYSGQRNHVNKFRKLYPGRSSVRWGRMICR